MIKYSGTLDAPCSIAPITSSLVSPDNHSSTVAYLTFKPWSLSIDIGRISIRELVMKFSIPFLVDASLTFDHVFDRMSPVAINLSSGPFDLAIAVLKGPIVSSANFIVGAVTIWCVVCLSTRRPYACIKVA